jgi:hypothetical protein
MSFALILLAGAALAGPLPPPTDLDGDGQPEAFTQRGEQVAVGGALLPFECAGGAFPCDVEVHDITARDGQKEVAQCLFGPRDDRSCRLYRFAGGTLTELPVRSQSGEELLPSRLTTKGNGILLADQGLRFYTRREKLVHQKGALKHVPQPFYDTGGLKVPVDRSFPITREPKGGAVVANVAPGTTVSLVLAHGTDPDVFLVLVSSGLMGWAHIETIAKGSDQVMATLGAG